MGDSDVRSWLRERAGRLDGPDTGAGDADLASLQAIWASADVVGLGESTHGTREFFTLKHRLIRFLVRELDLRVVALEASESASVAVDDYVRDGVGDGATALAGLRFWTWNTSEMLDVLEWLRQHNAELPAERRVRFVGIDPQRPEAAVAEVERHLDRTAPAERKRFAPTLDALRVRNTPADPPLPDTVLDRCRELHEVIGAADGEGSAARHTAHLVRSAQLATAGRDGMGPDSYYAVRDRLMAEGVAEAAESARCDGGLPVAVWAHNGHIARGSTAGAEVVPMGAHLAERYGRGYYALGLTVGAGRFHARRKRLLGGLTDGPVEHRMSRAPAVVLEGQLGAAVPADHIVDLRDPDPPEPVARWLNGVSWTRSFGAVASAMHRVAFTPVTPGWEFDGIGYVHRGRVPTPR